MTGASPPYTLNLMGAFRLFGPDGQRVEIASRKGVALVATLATAGDGERTRSWLQDKLWGTRQQSQAQGSLRRELSDLRKKLNFGSAPLLICDRDRVRLDLERVVLDIEDPDRRANGAVQDFLEGIDIPGEDGFEEWLREQRSALRARVAPQPAAAPPARPIGSPEVPASGVDLSQPAPGFDGRPALAVLPLANLTGNPANGYLAEGISEDLIDRLSRLRWLPVIARSSSFSFGASELDRGSISRRLGARYLLEGRLRRAPDGFALTASLSDAETGQVLWSPRLALPSASLIESLEPLVNDLVSVLDGRIDHAEQARARSGDRSNDELSLYELIWRGRWHLNRLTRADNEAANELFARALAIDPNCPEALIQATFRLGWSIWAQRGVDDEIAHMRKLAQRAIQADFEDGRGHMLAGIAEMWLKRPAPAIALLRQAIELNPSLSLAHVQLGTCYDLSGDAEAAVAQLKTGIRLSPNDVHLFLALAELGLAYSMLGEWDEAVRHADLALTRRPAYWYAHVIKVNALVRRGDLAGARRALGDLLRVKPNFSFEYMGWIPFVDRKWLDRLQDGLSIAASEFEAVHD